MLVVNARFLTQKITGVQRAAIEISLRLKEMYKDIKFVTPGNVIHKDLAEKLDAEKYGICSGHLWEQLELPRYLESKNNCLLLNLANTAPLYYRKKLVTIHDVAFLRYPQWFSKKFHYFYRFCIPRVVKNSLMIATVSEFSKKEISEKLKVPESKITVIFNAISDSFINSSENRLENKYNEYILAVSSLNPRKNFEGIVSAFNKLNLRNTKLVIVGCESKHVNNPKLKTMIKSNNRIIFAGHVSDDELIGLYKNARLLVFPSLYEGFGMPPLEAMACGCPCIVSNTSSLPEVCGEAALYCDPYKIEDIADNINKLLNNNKLKSRLVSSGFEHIKRFSWQKTTDTIAEMIDKVADV